MGGGTEWDSRMMDTLKNFDLNSPAVKQQFDQIGLSPEEVISKIMANPDFAMAFQNPRVQEAIMDEYPDYVPYITPMFFCDDWLNLYLDNFRMNTYSDKDQQNKEICCSDYRFVYMGVKGSWTPLHADQSLQKLRLDLGNGKTLDLERCSRSKLRKQCIKYLGPQERENYEYVVCDGKIINNQSGDFLHTKKDSEDAKWIFVMSTEKKLYAGKKKKGLFHHSSFLAGGATLAAGRLEAEDGVLKSISAYSGHYRPTDETLDAFLSYLRENGVNLVTFHEFCVGMRSLDQMVVKEGSWS
ncbi:unnamed protein product [Vicia faba]|uniref:JmjC domain-containing protein n=1 Tax=Vicia faba TaxID=3906 RepID=A0AAV1B6K8_VICFA|nr:unnamed protein product [Vicia faba]CAI8616412.1 unnamed protein product [Vicia faba]